METSRLTPYEAGWLTLLVKQGICTEREAQAAIERVVTAAIEAERAARKARKAKKRREQ